MPKIDKFNKKELQEYCQSIGINTLGKTKDVLKEEVFAYENNQIQQAVNNGRGLAFLTEKIESLAQEYANNLKTKVNRRIQEMKEDDNSHYLIYRILGISNQEGQSIDEFQNKGRFLYRGAGSFFEDAASLCLKFKNIDGGKSYVENNQGQSPKKFEIDFLDGNYAIEIKWRDATTDGDHTSKEKTRVNTIKSSGYTPIRIMFFDPQREQAQKIQSDLKSIYEEAGGQYYSGDDAWEFLKRYSGYDLKEILIKIANKRMPENGS